MSRTSSDEYRDGRLMNGYDYNHQTWVVNGKYQKCGHRPMSCCCYGMLHHGEETTKEHYIWEDLPSK